LLSIKNYKKDQGYIDLLVTKILPTIELPKKINLSPVSMLFCETGYFTVPETEQIMGSKEFTLAKPKLYIKSDLLLTP
jgi:hypothetical protein